MFYTTQCFIIYKVLSHTAGRQNPADRLGDGGIQGHRTITQKREKVANQKERPKQSPRQRVKRKGRTKKREVQEGEEGKIGERHKDRGWNQ